MIGGGWSIASPVAHGLRTCRLGGCGLFGRGAKSPLVQVIYAFEHDFRSLFWDFGVGLRCGAGCPMVPMMKQRRTSAFAAIHFSTVGFLLFGAFSGHIHMGFYWMDGGSPRLSVGAVVLWAFCG